MRTVFSVLITLLLVSTLNLTSSFAQDPISVSVLEHPDGVELIHSRLDYGYAPNSATFVTVGHTHNRDGTLYFWDVATGTLRNTINHPNGFKFLDVAFSPDSKMLASASNDRKVRLWDVATGTLVKTLVGHTADVWSVAFSPDGQMLASGSGDETVRLWDVATGTRTDTLDYSLHNASFQVHKVIFSPDGAILATQSYKAIHLWDVMNRRHLHNFRNGDNNIGGNLYHFAFSPDSTTFVNKFWRPGIHGPTASDNLGLWDVATGEHLRTFSAEYATYPVFNFDGSKIAASGRGGIHLWDVATGTLLNVFYPEAYGHFDFSPDGRALVAGYNRRAFYIWDVAADELTNTFRLPEPYDHYSIEYLKYSPDGATIAAVKSAGDEQVAFLWRLRPAVTITFTPAKVADQTFTVGTPVSLTLPTATGGTAPYTYTLSPTPAGLSFDTATQILSGTPTTAITATLATYTATDATGKNASLAFNITVTAAPATGITFSPSVIAPRTFVTGTPITPILLPVATGGTAPYTYTLVPLPDGLAFDAATRQLTGTPTTVASTSATYAVTDAASTTASLTFTINVIDGSTPGNVPDAALAAAIRRSLGLPADTALTTALINQLTNLDGYAQGITTLTGLEQATNLRTLDLGQNQIVDISTLASLTQLTHLYLDDNQITDVSALSGLRNLRLLRLAGNSIQDTSPLAALVQQNPGLDLDIPVTLPPPPTGVTVTDTKLETVIRTTLRLNPSEPITTSAMLNLTTLEAYNRRISSLSGLEHAVNLIALDLGKNAIVDLAPLAGLTQLEVLYLDDNQIVDVSPLAGLTNLDTLFLDGNPIASLAPISHLIDDIRVFRSRAAQ